MFWSNTRNEQLNFDKKKREAKKRRSWLSFELLH